jgi:hypothetical protein
MVISRFVFGRQSCKSNNGCPVFQPAGDSYTATSTVFNSSGCLHAVRAGDGCLKPIERGDFQPYLCPPAALITRSTSAWVVSGWSLNSNNTNRAS